MCSPTNMSESFDQSTSSVPSHACPEAWSIIVRIAGLVANKLGVTGFVVTGVVGDKIRLFIYASVSDTISVDKNTIKTTVSRSTPMLPPIHSLLQIKISMDAENIE